MANINNVVNVVNKVENYGGVNMENMNLSQETKKMYEKLAKMGKTSYMDIKNKFGTETKDMLKELVENKMIETDGVMYQAIKTKTQKKVAKPQQHKETPQRMEQKSQRQTTRKEITKTQGEIYAINTEKKFGKVRAIDGKSHLFFLSENEGVYNGMKVAFVLIEGKPGKEPIATNLTRDDTIGKVKRPTDTTQKTTVKIGFKNVHKKIAGAETPKGKIFVPFHLVTGKMNIGDEVEVEYFENKGRKITKNARIAKHATPYMKGKSKSPTVSNLNNTKEPEPTPKQEFFKKLEQRVNTYKTTTLPRKEIVHTKIETPKTEEAKTTVPKQQETKTPQRVFTRFGWRAAAKPQQSMETPQKVEQKQPEVETITTVKEPKEWNLTNLQRTQLKRQLIDYYQKQYNGSRDAAIHKMTVEIEEFGDRAFEILGYTEENAKEVRINGLGTRALTPSIQNKEVKIGEVKNFSL